VPISVCGNTTPMRIAFLPFQTDKPLIPLLLSNSGLAFCLARTQITGVVYA
jgi:hypothetical protein